MSTHDARDQWLPRQSMDEFDESRQVDFALAPWHFTSMPGINAAQWPDGLESFVTRLDELPPLALW